MEPSRRWQVSIGDILLFTALVAGIVAAFTTQVAPIAFVTACLIGVFLWHRPVGSRLWAVAMFGLGVGVLAGGLKGDNTLQMNDGDAVGWGAGMAAGSLAYLVVRITRPGT